MDTGARDPGRNAPRDEHVVVLQPDEKRAFTFDFTDKKLYFKNRDGKRFPSAPCRHRSRGSGSSTARRRGKRCKGLRKKDFVWHGYLPSRAFTGSGFID